MKPGVGPEVGLWWAGREARGAAPVGVGGHCRGVMHYFSPRQKQTELFSANKHLQNHARTRPSRRPKGRLGAARCFTTTHGDEQRAGGWRGGWRLLGAHREAARASSIVFVPNGVAAASFSFLQSVQAHGMRFFMKVQCPHFNGKSGFLACLALAASPQRLALLQLFARCVIPYDCHHCSSPMRRSPFASLDTHDA